MDHKQYAVAAIVEIARVERDEKSAGPVGAKSLSVRLGLAPRGLELQFQILRSAGILKSVRGPFGGYALGKPAKSLTVHAIYTALKQAQDDEIPEADLPEVAAVFATFQHAANAAETYLSRVTIADLLEKVPVQKAAA